MIQQLKHRFFWNTCSNTTCETLYISHIVMLSGPRRIIKLLQHFLFTWNTIFVVFSAFIIEKKHSEKKQGEREMFMVATFTPLRLKVHSHQKRCHSRLSQPHASVRWLFMGFGRAEKSHHFWFERTFRALRTTPSCATRVNVRRISLGLYSSPWLIQDSQRFAHVGICFHAADQFTGIGGYEIEKRAYLGLTREHLSWVQTGHSVVHGSPPYTCEREREGEKKKR